MTAFPVRATNRAFLPVLWRDPDRVIAPPPLGRMGRRLQALAEAPVMQRSIELYAALAEVAR